MAQLIKAILGHELQMENLIQAIGSDKLPHALIFSGPPSIGKKMLAMGIAQILVCEHKETNSSSACGVCGPCLRVEKQQSENMKLISPEGAHIKAEQVRGVLDYLSLANFGKNRVIIFDQAHLMNQAAANSLLKILEEPNPNVYFILIGPEISNFMSTIKSRSQVIRFSALTQDQLKMIRPNLPNWSYSCARGQVEQLTLLTSEDGQKHREDSLLLLEHFWSDPDFLLSDDWKKMMKDRDYARLVVQVWFTMVRDVLILKTSAQKLIMNLDQAARLKKIFQISTDKISSFSEGLLQVDRDLAGNGDSILIFESLWVKYAR